MKWSLGTETAETLIDQSLPSASTQSSTATPDHRKVASKKRLHFIMEPSVRHFKLIKEERFIANLPWKIALAKNVKSGFKARNDGSADSHCICKSKYNLQSIDPANRSPKEVETWNEVLETAEKQARIRAVQMHLNVITGLNALPLSIKCCERSQSLRAAVALQGFHTDELERDWIYDTGAGACFLGWEVLTDHEKRN